MMRFKTPFFPALVKAGWGPRRRGSVQRLLTTREALRRGFASQWQSLFEPVFQAVDATGEDRRKRRFPALVAVASMVHQRLGGGVSIRSALRALQCNRDTPGSSSTAGLAQARGRVRRQFLLKLLGASVNALEATCAGDRRRILLVDGTGISMADTPDNQRDFPASSRAKEGCGFPVAQMVGLFDLEHGGVIHAEITSMHVGEQLAFEWELSQHLRPGDLLVGDTAYYAYWQVHKLRSRQIDVLFPVARGVPARVRTLQSFQGKKDRLVEFTKPNHHRDHLERDFVASLPKTQAMRMVQGVVLNDEGYPVTVTLVTTLTDHKKYPRDEILRLYQRRWQVEVNFRDLKQTMGLARLRSRTAAMAEKEIIAGLLAYNLVRLIIRKSAAHTAHAVPSQRISFAGALACLQACSPQLHAARTHPTQWQHLHDQLLHLIASDAPKRRPDRTEPRKVKFRGRKYAYLTKPRKIEKQLIKKHRETLLS